MLMLEIMKSISRMDECNRGLSRYFFLRKNLPPARQRPPIANRTAALLSGTAVAAENENREDAEGSWVVKLNVPGVVVKPLWETFPVP
jgi:hypothetical protein